MKKFQITRQKFEILILGSSSFLGKNFCKYTKLKNLHIFQRSKQFLTKNDNNFLIKKNFFNIINNYIIKNKITHIINFISNNNNNVNIKNSTKKKIYYANVGFHERLFYSIKVKTLIIINFSSSEILRSKNENFYRKTKKSFNKLVNYYKKKSNFKIINLKIPNVYGPYDKNFNRIIPYIISSQIKNNKIMIINPKKKIRFIFSKDLIKKIDYLIKNNNFNRPIHSDVKINEIFQYIFHKKSIKNKYFQKNLKITHNWYKNNL